MRTRILSGFLLAVLISPAASKSRAAFEYKLVMSHNDIVCKNVLLAYNKSLGHMLVSLRQNKGYSSPEARGTYFETIDGNFALGAELKLNKASQSATTYDADILNDGIQRKVMRRTLFRGNSQYNELKVSFGKPDLIPTSFQVMQNQDDFGRGVITLSLDNIARYQSGPQSHSSIYWLKDWPGFNSFEPDKAPEISGLATISTFSDNFAATYIIYNHWATFTKDGSIVRQGSDYLGTILVSKLFSGSLTDVCYLSLSK